MSEHPMQSRAGACSMWGSFFLLEFPDNFLYGFQGHALSCKHETHNLLTLVSFYFVVHYFEGVGVKKKYLTPAFFFSMIAEVINVNEILEQALLYDFYGELLTDHQKEIYEQFMLEDFSLSEIAQGEGISRQGVHDLVRRCQKILEGYEAKLHLVEKFLSVKEKVREINEALDAYEKEGTDINTMVGEIRQISHTIIEEL